MLGNLVEEVLLSPWHTLCAARLYSMKRESRAAPSAWEPLGNLGANIGVAGVNKGPIMENMAGLFLSGSWLYDCGKCPCCETFRMLRWTRTSTCLICFASARCSLRDWAIRISRGGWTPN